MVFKYLKDSYETANPVAREKMHNASAMAGMAFGNAFLGVCHAMAHQVGSEFGIPHGRTNAILLPHTIRYNGVKQGKLSVWPKYNHYHADERYYELALAIGLKPKTVEEGVKMFADACYELGKSVGIEMNFKAKVLEKDFKAQVTKQLMQHMKINVVQLTQD